MARSELKKAARIAKSICDLSNPMLSISAIWAALSAPIAKPEELPDGADAPVPAGVGVAGTSPEVDEPVCATGAAGGAGVEATAGAGVAGGFVGVEVDADAAGTALG
jgi:hypothetical protein